MAKKIKLKTLYVCDRCGSSSNSSKPKCNCENEWKLEHAIIYIIPVVLMLVLIWAVCNI